MEGQILGNRYEVIEKIGGGGMSIVYKAKCSLLNRFVAVKILRPEFTQDEEFVKRFRIEAQSAASLSHPNIVSIYDVGNDNGTYYIIMEYIDGITLKEYVDSKEALEWREAVNIAIQIGSAIDHAHKNHIVHRDIKPHNIMLTKDGIAKVTDFGIARAVSSSTITMVGSTIGSVHYFSPEQARGGFVDEKSDLYSLGITLYEMVTGRLPFDGETPIAVALKHIQLDAKPPIELNEDIPKALNDIIMKGIKKEQNKRYQSAPKFLADLSLLLKDPTGNFVIISESEESPTRRIKTVGDETNGRREDYLIKDYDEDSEKAKKTKKVDKLTLILAIITGAVLIVFLTYLIGVKVATYIEPAEKQDFVVENYVGKNIDDIKKIFDDANIKVIRNDEFRNDVPEGEIISQDIVEGKTLKRDGFNTIEFNVSKGVETVKIPDLSKSTRVLAEDTITNLGLSTNIIKENSETVAENFVIRTDPPKDEEVAKGTNIYIYISSGPEIKPTIVPNLIGLTQKEALQLLSDAKLVIGKQIPEIGSDYTAKITTQNPLPNTEVKEGDAVDLVYTKTVVIVNNQQYILELANPEFYGDTINVRITAMEPGSENPVIFLEQPIKKDTFPLIVKLAYPDKTIIKIYLNDEPYEEKVIPF